jgi:hypothetical protein
MVCVFVLCVVCVCGGHTHKATTDDVVGCVRSYVRHRPRSSPILVPLPLTISGCNPPSTTPRRPPSLSNPKPQPPHQVLRDILAWGEAALPPVPESEKEAYPYFAFLPNLQARLI